MAAAASDPGEGPLHDPSLGKDNKPFRMDRPQDRLKHPTEGLLDPGWQIVAAVGAVAEDHSQASEGLELVQDKASSVIILPVCSMHHERPHQTERVDGQMPLAAGDLFPGVKATFLASFRCANRLAVDDRHTGRRLLASLLANPPAESLVNCRPDTISTPTPEDRVDRLPLRKVMRQLPPLAARANHIQNRIDNPPTANRPSTTSGLLGKEATNHSPLPIRQTAGILRAHRYGSVFLDLETQKAES